MSSVTLTMNHIPRYLRSQVDLPENVLNEKIERARKHLEHLSTRLGEERNTHGGKAYREHKASIQLQMNETEKRISIYQKAISIKPKEYHPIIIAGIGMEQFLKIPVVPFASLQAKHNFRDPGAIDPKNMPASVVRGEFDNGSPFIAIRVAPVNKYTMENAFVDFLFANHIGSKPYAHWVGTDYQSIIDPYAGIALKDFEKVGRLLQGEAVLSAGSPTGHGEVRLI